MKGGYMGKILRIDLTKQEYFEAPVSKDLVNNYIGGRGFGAKILYDELKPKTDPFSPNNLMIFTVGPVTATGVQSGSRWMVVTKSPLTMGYLRTIGGGDYGAMQKFTGYDIIIIKGKAKKPIYLYINDGKCEFRDASKMWGYPNELADKVIKKDLHNPKASIALIGPAGEKLVRLSGIFNLDRDGFLRSASRGGAGAVMGSKNLKGIAVYGTNKVPIANPDALRAILKEQLDSMKENFLVMDNKTVGTQIAEFTNELGMFPTKNFREGILPKYRNIDRDAFNKTRIGHGGCYGCSQRCGSVTLIQEGKYAGAYNEGPEYESIWAFTGTIKQSNQGVTVVADALCDQLGLDTISVGNAIGFAYELYEKKIITKKDVGMDLKWGDEKPMLQLIRMIGTRTGIGDILAEGTKRAAEIIGKGAEKYAMHVRGMEIPAYDPRGAKAQGLSMVTGTAGANHNIGYAPQEMFGNKNPFPVDRFSTKRKGELAKFNQDRNVMWETGVVCTFLPYPGVLDPEKYGKTLKAITEIEAFNDPAYIWKVSERIYNLERLINFREGFSRKHDNYPERIKNEPIRKGSSDGEIFEQEKLLDDYFKVRGWDIKTGIPTKKKLKELGLDFAKKLGK
jgi:aldehyde:ferredoxin oxidoreductase